MKERILIIEDDEGILRVLRRALTYEGYQVETALDGESGLSTAHEWRPDLIVLDLMLPGMDGMEVNCQRYHQRPGVGSGCRGRRLHDQAFRAG